MKVVVFFSRKPISESCITLGSTVLLLCLRCRPLQLLLLLLLLCLRQWRRRRRRLRELQQLQLLLALRPLRLGKCLLGSWIYRHLPWELLATTGSAAHPERGGARCHEEADHVEVPLTNRIVERRLAVPIRGAAASFPVAIFPMAVEEVDYK
jgi:hypothetical protein